MLSTRAGYRTVAPTLALLLLSACAATPTTRMLVPSINQMDKVEKLGQQPGTIATLLTTTSQERLLLLDRSMDRSFSGHVLDPAAGYDGRLAGPILKVPFDEVALIFYTSPPSKPFQLAEWVPLPYMEFPSLPSPGETEQRASCADLDVELARAETLRWSARAHGAVPFTPGEAAKTHVKNAAKYTAITVLAIAAMAAGGCCGGSGAPTHVSEEAWRWAVTAADRRTIGLLQLKQGMHCDARAVAGADRSDLQILEQIEGVNRERAAGRLTEADESAQKTTWLDMLNPVPLVTAEQRIEMYGDGPGESFDRAVWSPGRASLFDAGIGNERPGTIILTGKSLIVHLEPTERAPTGQDTRIAYADIASVEMKQKLRAHWIVVTRMDGHVDSFWFVHEVMLDRERTEAVGQLLRSRIPATQPSAAEHP